MRGLLAATLQRPRKSDFSLARPKSLIAHLENLWGKRDHGYDLDVDAMFTGSISYEKTKG